MKYIYLDKSHLVTLTQALISNFEKSLQETYQNFVNTK